MRHFSFDELSFTNHDPVEVTGGSRPRLVLEHSRTKQRYFLKTYRYSAREVWAEMFASQLGQLVGLEIQAVSLKKIPKSLERFFHRIYKDYLPEGWKPVGTLVRNIFPKRHEILYGRTIIGTASDPVQLEQIENDIRSRYLDSEDILQDFANMVVFDAWIGNMDRHHENWAIIQKKIVIQLSLLKLSKEEREKIKLLRKFTPLFDHGSSLLFELSDADVVKYLKDKKLFNDSYILGKKYALLLGMDGTEKNIYEVIHEHINAKTKWGKRFVKSIDLISSADSLSVARLILQMPTGGDLDYSSERKKLLYYSLERRRNILVTYCKELREVSDEDDI